MGLKELKSPQVFEKPGQSREQGGVFHLQIILPCLNGAEGLGVCLDSLQETESLIGPDRVRICLVDGGSRDESLSIARNAGVDILTSPRGRGQQLRKGAEHCLADPGAGGGLWLLFLHVDTVLETGWSREVAAFCSDPENHRRFAAFHFALDRDEPAARRLEKAVAWRCDALKLPYGDQGLLLHEDLYREAGGYAPVPLMEDVTLVRTLVRITGRKGLQMLSSRAVTSGLRYRRGYLRRSARNLFCLALWGLGIPPRFIVKLYS